MIKTCKIIPIYRKPVYNVLPAGKAISVPSMMPLNESQILKATLQGSVYEVVEGKGDVILTRTNRYADNSKATVSVNIPAIVNYYTAEGKECIPYRYVPGDIEADATEDAEETAEEQVEVEEPTTAEQTKEEPAEDKVDEATVETSEEAVEVEAPVEESKEDAEDIKDEATEDAKEAPAEDKVEAVKTAEEVPAKTEYTAQPSNRRNNKNKK